MPRRAYLLGIWLMLLFNVGTYDSGLPMILICPLLWWLRAPRQIWRNINFTLIWFLIPVVKLAQIALLAVGGRYFYGLRFTSGSSVTDFISPERAVSFLDTTAAVYRQTFLIGWQEALDAMGQAGWLAPGTVILGVVAIVALFLYREGDPAALPSNKRLTVVLVAGLLLILPSFAVLALLGIYSGGMWRAYIYVPVGASIALVSLVALATAPVKAMRRRQLLIIGTCLLLILPGIARLSLQQRQYQREADTEARVLRQIVEQAPSIDPEAHLMLYTNMSADEFAARGIWHLEWGMLDSAVYMLYRDRGPKVAFLCKSSGWCSRDNIAKFVGSRDFLGGSEDYHDVVIFQLHEDLRVELLRELPPELRERAVNRYDPERLIDFSAPVPPRARSLLGAAWRD